jgi:hypothetical protein
MKTIYNVHIFKNINFQNLLYKRFMDSWNNDFIKKIDILILKITIV